MFVYLMQHQYRIWKKQQKELLDLLKTIPKVSLINEIVRNNILISRLGYFSAIISNKEEIYLRKKQTIEDILLTQMTIPEKLLTSYTSLGLSEVDVMLILQIYRFM